jgi:hypothetical protein
VPRSHDFGTLPYPSRPATERSAVTLSFVLCPCPLHFVLCHEMKKKETCMNALSLTVVGHACIETVAEHPPLTSLFFFFLFFF